MAKFGKIVNEGKDKIIDVKEIENIAQYEAVEAVEAEAQEPVPVFVEDYSEAYQAAIAREKL